MRKGMLLVGKGLIVFSLLWPIPFGYILQFGKYTFGKWPPYQYWLPLLGVMALGIGLCAIANNKVVYNDERSSFLGQTLVVLFFKTIKWIVIIIGGLYLVGLTLVGLWYLFYVGGWNLATGLFSLGLPIGVVGYYGWQACHNYNLSQKKEYEDHVLRVISVGTFSQDPVLEIYVRKNDGCIPRFFIRAYEKEWRPGKRFNACMRLRDDCFPYEHVGAEDNLTKEQRSQLFEYLGSGVGAYKNWHRLIDAWNYGNPDTPVPYDLQCYFIIT